jgi:hypothetical protein
LLLSAMVVRILTLNGGDVSTVGFY